MTFMPLAVVAAVLLVIVTRGSLLRLGRLPVRGLELLFAGLAIQGVLPLVGIPRSHYDDVGFGLLIASYALILTFAFTNLHIRGMTIVAVGIALNALVIALNQGMPAKGPTRTTTDGRRVSRVITSVKHRLERPGDVLTVLDDRIVLSHDLLSFGDLVLVAGLLDVCFWGSRRDDEAWMSVFAMPMPEPNRRRTRPGAGAHTFVPARTTDTHRVKDDDVERVEDNELFLSDDDIVIDLSQIDDEAKVPERRSGQLADARERATTRSSAARTRSSYR